MTTTVALDTITIIFRPVSQYLPTILKKKIRLRLQGLGLVKVSSPLWSFW